MPGRRGLARTGNPFHRVPLLFTTKDTEGKLISFMPGGPRILDSRKQDVVICMTLDAENNEIPIPFMGDGTGVVHEMSDLSETPQDGLIAIVEKAELRTEGRRKFFPLEEVPAVFFPFELPLNEIFGISSIDFLNCTFGTHTGPLSVLFAEEADVLDIGLSGPIMLISNGDEETADLLYIRTAQAGLLEGFQEVVIAVDAGWNKLVKTNNIWRQTPIAVSAIPAITDVTVKEFYVDTVAYPFASDAEWVWITGLAYSLGGEWHGERREQLPPFLSVFPEHDEYDAWKAAMLNNEYGIKRHEAGETGPPIFVDMVAIIAGYLNASGYIDVYVPTATEHTAQAMKPAIITALEATLLAAFGAHIHIDILDFEYFDIPQSQYGEWDGTMVWSIPDMPGLKFTEPFEHDGTRVTFSDEPRWGH